MKKNIYIQNLQCLGCGNIFPMPRKKNQKRENHHIKHLYCVHCKNVMPHMEIKEDDLHDFTEETIICDKHDGMEDIYEYFMEKKEGK